MAVVVSATGTLLRQILDETFPLWGEGLDRAGYARYNAAQLLTPWGASQLRRVALVEGSEWLATAKVFDLLLAVPKYGRVKVNRILTQCRISPSKTIGGLSERQRNELVSYLRR